MNDIDRAIENDIDAAIERKHGTVCNLCDGSGYIKSNTIEYEGECPDLPHPTICFSCKHGEEHHDDGDRCRFETCQCKCFE